MAAAAPHPELRDFIVPKDAKKFSPTQGIVGSIPGGFFKKAQVGLFRFKPFTCIISWADVLMVVALSFT